MAVISRTPNGWTEQEVIWVRRKWALIRESQQMADVANKEWKRINEHINARHDATDLQRRRTGQAPLTDLSKAEDKAASLPLTDAMATGDWHSRNAERHIHDVQLFLKLKELELL